MFKLTSGKRKIAAGMCMLSLLAQLTVFANGKDKESVIITIGKPSVWTLAQAHYLLAQMHHKNLGLKSKSPTDQDLDPNAINRKRAEMLQRLFGISATFDQPLGIKNGLQLDRLRRDTARAQAIKQQMDQRRDELLIVSRRLSNLRFDLEKLKADKAPETQIKLKEAEIRAREEEKTVLESQINSLTAEAGTLATDPTDLDLDSPNLGDSPIKNLGSTATMDNLINKLGNDNPKLNASTILDNHIQMQYEIIAKQLTLLRDEVGPNERVIFLELPCSIYAVPVKSDSYLAQVRWSVQGYTAATRSIREKENKFKPKEAYEGNLESSYQRLLSSQMTFLTTEQDSSAAASKRIDDFTAEGPTEKIELKQGSLEAEAITSRQIVLRWKYKEADSSKKPHRIVIERMEREGSYTRIARTEPGAEEFSDIKLAPDKFYRYRIYPEKPEGMKKLETDWVKTKSLKEDLAQIRTVDIIPRQSALNVAEAHNTTKGFALSGKFLSVFGFGAAVDFQRQKEVYDQFVYQDMFASGFGKGENKFGWTFGPLPGSRRLAPGVRTTYAVLIVPNDAETISIRASAYAFERDKPQPKWDASCNTNDDFELEIPSETRDGFWLENVDYTPVRSGQRVTAVFRGVNFSPQIGILVNGKPLRRAVSIANGEREYFSGQNSLSVDGEYEIVSSEKIIASFSMGDDYEGTPIITLITPQKTSEINHYTLFRRNGRPGDSLAIRSLLQPMFIAPLKIERLEITDKRDDKVDAQLIGSGFRPDAIITINDKTTLAQGSNNNATPDNKLISYSQDSTRQYSLMNFTAPTEPVWNITIRQKTKQGFEEFSRTVIKPLTPRLSYEILSYRPDNPRTPARDGYLAFRLEAHNLGTIAKSDVVPINSNDATILDVQKLSDGEWLITATPNADTVLLKITGSKGTSAIVTILAPLSPAIETIKNPANGGKAEGPEGGGYTVEIHGSNLENVARVKFGATDAPILEISPEIILVTVPGGKDAVRITLETNIIYKGRRVTNAADLSDPTKSLFKYVAPPKKDENAPSVNN